MEKYRIIMHQRTRIRAKLHGGRFIQAFDEEFKLKPIEGGVMSIKSNKEIAFATLLKQGKSKEELMKRFSLGEAQYLRVVADVKRIEAEEEQAKKQ